MGGGLEADLSHGAVAALWSSPDPAMAVWRPVLQVAGVRRVPNGCPDPEEDLRYSVELSDGVHLQRGTLAITLNPLVRAGALRRGSVVRVLQFVCDSIDNTPRTIIVIQLEVLQTDCALIGSPKPYEPAVEVMPSGSFQLAAPDGWKVLAQIKNERLGYSDKPDIVRVKALISFIDTESFCFAVCPMFVNGTQCYAKVHRIGDKRWHCKRCFQDFETCDYRYKVPVQIQDHTAIVSAIIYPKAGNKIFGCTAKELYSLKDEQQTFPWFANIIHGVLCTEYVFKLRVDAKPFYSWRYADCTILEAEKVDPSAESHRLLGVINTLLEKGSRSDSEFRGSIPSYIRLSDPKARSSVQSPNFVRGSTMDSEFRGSIPSYIRLSDPKARSSVQSPNSDSGISCGHARWLGSADGPGQINGYAMEPASLSTTADILFCVSCGSCVPSAQAYPPGEDRQQSSPPWGFLGSFYGALPVDKASGMCFKCKQITEHRTKHRVGKS